jgi:inosine-uridine nucleoside N-ribohydrolase
VTVLVCGRDLIIDTDVGYDDTAAISLLMNEPQIDIIGITSVRGNTHVLNGTRNLLKMLAYFNRSDVPVYMGTDSVPSGGVTFPEQWMEYCETLEYLSLPSDDNLKPQNLGAVEYMVQTFKAAPPQSITLLGIGPLTNIAGAIKADLRSFENAVESIWLMGGNPIGCPHFF